MSIESQAPVAHTEPVSVENKAPEQELNHQQQQQQAQDTTGVDGAVAALAISQPQQPGADLHRACADGRLDDVRAILGRSLDALETLGESFALYAGAGFF